MKKETRNDLSPAAKDKRKQIVNNTLKQIDRIQARDVDHGDIEYDPSDPHGLTIKETLREKKK